MCKNMSQKFIWVVIFMFGVSHSESDTTTQNNPKPGHGDVTSSPGATTFDVEQATLPTYSTPSNSVSNFVGQSDVHNTSATTTTDTPKTKLLIAGFYSGRSGHWDGTGMKPAVELALKHVNERPDILENYELDVQWKDSRCDPADGVWTFHSHLIEEPKKVMLLGPPCSPDAEPVARTSERGNLVTVSYSAASPDLSNKETHPYFFRTYKTDVIFNPARIWLFDHFNWTRIGSIHENKDLFTLTHDHLYELLRGENVTVEVKEIFDKRPSFRQMERMKEEDIKIILASAYKGPARELFCKAYHSGLYGKGYVWILLGWYNRDWYRKGSATENCTNEQVETAVEESMYISMEAANFSETPDDMTVAGYSANEITRQLEEYWDENATASGLEMFGYDALWAIALALNRTDEVLAKDQYKSGRLEDFSYNAKDVVARNLGSLLFKAINSTSFQGASGQIDFPFGDQFGRVNIEQLQPYCDEGWHLFSFSCYKLVNETKSWSDSRQYCKDLAPEKRSHLVSILSHDESVFLENRSKDSWYIGLTYNQYSDELNWVDTKNSHVGWWPQLFNSKEENSRCYFWNVDTRNWESSKCEIARNFICKRRANFEEQVIVTLSANKTGASFLKWKGSFMWYDDEIPKDQTQPVEEGLSRAAYIVLAVCACLGIVLAISLLTFNILARSHRIVKLSSPNLNNLIVVGCIMIYVSICLLRLEVVHPNKSRVPVPAFCMLRLWLVSVGFVLGFGAIFSKIWRVYRVANIKRAGAKKVVIKDSQLFGLVGFLLLPDVILLVLWTITDPLKHQLKTIDMDSYVHICECNHFSIWAMVLCIYKGLILVIGVFLAWETRNVTITALNDSKSIGLCIYTTTLLCVIGVATAFPFPDVPAYQHQITSGCMLFCTTFVLLVVFVPKIWFVYKPPKCDRTSSTTALHGTVSSRIQASTEPTIDIGGTDKNGNVVTGHLASFAIPFTSRRKQSYDVEDETKREEEPTTSNRVRKNSAHSIDEVLE